MHDTEVGFASDHTRNRFRLLPVVAAGIALLGSLNSVGAESERPGKSSDVFAAVTRHIQRQIESDKAAFARASDCTNWFYEQEKKKPAPAPVQPIRFGPALQVLTREDCLRAYPGGLEAVRQDFHRTQSSLSLSLTFYEFILVGDRNDDHRYNRDELRDLFQALGLSYEPARPSVALGGSLTERFDEWYRTRNMEGLMAGMGQLYEQGYRVTPADRADIDRATK
ncbi:MAG: hypothetical protein U0412_13565 [Nitrospira sp.]